MRAESSARHCFDPAFEDLPERLPIFPLTEVLLLPGGRLPLNIFEPRYLAMVRHVLTRPDRLIGMVQPLEEGADRLSDPSEVPAVQRIGCAGRIVSFEETEDGRYRIALLGLVRFSIRRELSPDQGGFRLVAPDFTAWSADMTYMPFTLAGRPGFMALLRKYFDRLGIAIDWRMLDSMPDDRLVVALAMLCPFSPQEKQSLLECRDIETLASMLVALYELFLREAGRVGQSLH